MRIPPDVDLYLPDPGATDTLANALMQVLRAGDTLLLDGPLGAGKSQVARGIIQTLQARSGPVEDVPSPTYTLVQTYAAGDLVILHADLYRLQGPAEVAELGLFDDADATLRLIEWPDRMGAQTPRDALWLTLSHRADGRQARLHGQAPWPDRLAACDG